MAKHLRCLSHVLGYLPPDSPQIYMKTCPQLPFQFGEDHFCTLFCPTYWTFSLSCVPTALVGGFESSKAGGFTLSQSCPSWCSQGETPDPGILPVSNHALHPHRRLGADLRSQALVQVRLIPNGTELSRGEGLPVCSSLEISLVPLACSHSRSHPDQPGSKQPRLAWSNSQSLAWIPQPIELSAGIWSSLGNPVVGSQPRLPSLSCSS